MLSRLQISTEINDELREKHIKIRKQLQVRMKNER